MEVVVVALEAVMQPQTHSCLLAGAQTTQVHGQKGGTDRECHSLEMINDLSFILPASGHRFLVTHLWGSSEAKPTHTSVARHLTYHEGDRTPTRTWLNQTFCLFGNTQQQTTMIQTTPT